jgi:DNA-binding transcriptional LysR family regulator
VQEVWRLEGQDGPVSIRVNGNIRTNSSEVVRESVIAGLGIALRSTWDVGSELKSEKLKIILSEYHESPRVAVYAVYPCRQFIPAKLRVFIDYLGNLYGPDPYWDNGLEFSIAS